jgi:hypothetical protein
MSRADLENLQAALGSGPSALLALLDEDVRWDYVGRSPKS